MKDTRDYQEVVDGNLFTIDPSKPYKAKGFYNPTTKDVLSQPWFPCEHEDNMIGYLYYKEVGADPHKFVATEEFGGKEYNLNN